MPEGTEIGIVTGRVRPPPCGYSYRPGPCHRNPLSEKQFQSEDQQDRFQVGGPPEGPLVPLHSDPARSRQEK